MEGWIQPLGLVFATCGLEGQCSNGQSLGKVFAQLLSFFFSTQYKFYHNCFSLRFMHLLSWSKEHWELALLLSFASVWLTGPLCSLNEIRTGRSQHTLPFVFWTGVLGNHCKASSWGSLVSRNQSHNICLTGNFLKLERFRVRQSLSTDFIFKCLHYRKYLCSGHSFTIYWGNSLQSPVIPAVCVMFWEEGMAPMLVFCLWTTCPG